MAGDAARHRRAAVAGVVAARAGAVPARRADRLGGPGARLGRRRAGPQGRLGASGGARRGRRAAGVGRTGGGAAARGRAVRRHARAAAGALPAGHVAGRPAGAGAGPGERRQRRLWIAPPAGHVFRPLQQMCERWAEEFDTRLATEPGRIDPGLAREGIALFRALPASAGRRVLLATDLHAGNVLAARREPWLAIDPKPYVGDPTYDPLQHLPNCAQRLHADPGGLAERMAELLGSTHSGCGAGCSPGACRSRRTGRRWPTSPVGCASAKPPAPAAAARRRSPWVVRGGQAARPRSASPIAAGSAPRSRSSRTALPSSTASRPSSRSALVTRVR